MRRRRSRVQGIVLSMIMLFTLIPLSSIQVKAATPITLVDINGYVEPEANGHPIEAKDLSVPKDAPYTISGVVWKYQEGATWENVKEPYSKYYFQRDVLYTCAITVSPKAGYTFDTNVKILINGKEDLRDKENSSIGPWSVFFWTKDKKPSVRGIVNEININGFKEPDYGETTQEAGTLSVPAGSNYKIESLQWFKNNTNIGEHVLIDAGKWYAFFAVRPKPGYIFGYPVTWKINGDEKLIDATSPDLNWGRAYTIDYNLKVPWTVSFAPEGGSGTMKDAYANQDDTFVLPLCSFTPPQGKVFEKWDLGPAGTKITLKSDTVLKAVWKDAGPKDSPIPPAQVSPENPIPLSSIEAAIPTRKNDKDLKCSSFSLLQAKGEPKGETSIKLSWKKVKGAAGYIIYGNKCGKKNHYVKLKTTAKTSYKQKKLEKGTYYKYIVVAFKGDQALAASKTIHVATNGGKNGNNTAVTLDKKKLTIKRKKKAAVKAILRHGPLPVKNHRAVAFESGDYRIATVTSKGKIKGVKKGTCYIYAYAQNGMCAKVKVKVKK